MRDKCSGCGNCIDVCPAKVNTLSSRKLFYDRTACVLCGKCVDACPEQAREIVGQDMSVEEIIEFIEKDAVFYRSSGGGVTFSGGEPFAQMEVLRKLAKRCASAGIRTAVETSGFFSLTGANDIFAHIDEIFIDLKHINDERHHKLTGVSNKRIIANIVCLDKAGYSLTIRVPLIKDITATPENIDGIINLCARLKNLNEVELLPYHNLGAEKYASIDLPFDNHMKAPEQETIQLILDQIQNQGLKAKSADLLGR